MATSSASARMAEPMLIGHPRGLFVLFFAEMWERFSYYGMRALLIFYLTKHFLIDAAHASVIYGAYTSLVYITPVVGGWLADRYLGGRRAVLFGGVLIAIGHFCLAIEGPQAVQGAYLRFFFLGLAFIIVGTGFLKANISAIVGTLYARDDLRRDPAYTIFYMGINVGAALGAIVCGWLGERVGWSWGFGSAGVGMLLGLIVFVAFRRDLLGRSEPPDPALLAVRTLGIGREHWIYLAALGSVMLAWALIQHQAIVGTLLGLFGAALVAYVVYTAVVKLPAIERDRIFAALALIMGSILFWALFEQAGSSLNIYTDQSVDRRMLGVEMPASIFQSVNSFWIIAMAPPIAWAWTRLGRAGREPSALAKFGLAMIQLGLGFLVLVAGASAYAGSLTPAVFIILLYLFHSTGELCLSPVGLSAMTKMALPQMTGLLMGTWFFATAAGEFSAGLIASAVGATGDASRAGAIAVYGKVGWLAVGVGVLLMIIAPLFRRLMHLDRLETDARAPAGASEMGEPGAAGLHPERELRA